MRPTRVAVVALLLLAGCDQFAYVLRPDLPYIEVERWRDVPEGQTIIAANVGDVLHLPLGEKVNEDNYLPPMTRVKVNGAAADSQSYSVAGTTMSYVFRAERPGQYLVETCVLFDTESKSPQKWLIVVTR